MTVDDQSVQEISVYMERTRLALSLRACTTACLLASAPQTGPSVSQIAIHPRPCPAARAALLPARLPSRRPNRLQDWLHGQFVGSSENAEKNDSRYFWVVPQARAELQDAVFCATLTLLFGVSRTPSPVVPHIFFVFSASPSL